MQKTDDFDIVDDQIVFEDFVAVLTSVTISSAFFGKFSFIDFRLALESHIVLMRSSQTRLVALHWSEQLSLAYLKKYYSSQSVLRTSVRTKSNVFTQCSTR